MGAPPTNGPRLPSFRADSAELGPEPPASGLPGDCGDRNRTQHFVGGLHQPGFLQVERDRRGAGQVDVIAVWHVQNDAQCEASFLQTRRHRKSNNPPGRLENYGPRRVGGI